MAESFFATLKTEFYYRRIWPTKARARPKTGPSATNYGPSIAINSPTYGHSPAPPSNGPRNTASAANGPKLSFQNRTSVPTLQKTSKSREGRTRAK